MSFAYEIMVFKITVKPWESLGAWERRPHARKGRAEHKQEFNAHWIDDVLRTHDRKILINSPIQSFIPPLVRRLSRGGIPDPGDYKLMVRISKADGTLRSAVSESFRAGVWSELVRRPTVLQ